ncbi:hypothetical protein RPE78_06960 [Thioclava litoralis]|uniref:Uncharacterized protein n=1 Tax=Thioclava litoralis TaxID=3076557 RepID=A0ABZ1DUS0_9RHOB|nr:hypothetical protein RPE78_06960 [Thioclava sp. FTW29]
MNTVIPGLAPWNAVLAPPYLWHFAFNAIPDLPERLITGNIAPYFDYFYDYAQRPEAITLEMRSEYVRSYATESALHQGVELYRAFRQDALDNAGWNAPVMTPVLYVRGAFEGGGYVRLQSRIDRICGRAANLHDY